MTEFEVHKKLTAIILAGVTSGDDNTSRVARNIAHALVRQFPELITPEKRAEELAARVTELEVALKPFAQVTVLLTGEVVGLERQWFTDAKSALAQETPHE